MNTSTSHFAAGRSVIFPILLVFSVGVPVAPGQPATPREPPAAEGVPPDRRSPSDIYDDIIEMNEAVKKMGPWEEQYADIAASMNNMWRQNGWDAEADRYALDLALEVSKVPPWEFARRMEVLTGRMRARYGLSESEALAMRGNIVREIGGMVYRHAGVIFEQVGQYIELRSKHEPMTPELIAEWTQGSDAVWADVVQTVERITGEIRETLDPERQGVMDRDLASFHRRAKYWDDKRKVWRKGGWKPEDWGMQDDPIQMGRRRAPDRSGLGPARVRPSVPGSADGGPRRLKPSARGEKTAGKWLAYDPNTWMAYVNHVAERYGLDEAQRNTCRTIHKDKFDRAAAYAKAHDDDLAGIPVEQRATDEAFEPIRGVFSDLQKQLEAVATPKQRRESKP